MGGEGMRELERERRGRESVDTERHATSEKKNKNRTYLSTDGVLSR